MQMYRKAKMELNQETTNGDRNGDIGILYIIYILNVVHCWATHPQFQFQILIGIYTINHLSTRIEFTNNSLMLIGCQFSFCGGLFVSCFLRLDTLENFIFTAITFVAIRPYGSKGIQILPLGHHTMG